MFSGNSPLQNSALNKNSVYDFLTHLLEAKEKAEVRLTRFLFTYSGLL